MKEEKKKMPRGIRNCNPLNIRKGAKWKGLRAVQTDPAFCQFKSMVWGIRAAFRLMHNHITGFGGSRPRCDTVEKLISVWAPATENDTKAYVAHVCRLADCSPSTHIDPHDDVLIIRIARTMAMVECGVWLDVELFNKAYELL